MWLVWTRWTAECSLCPVFTTARSPQTCATCWKESSSSRALSGAWTSAQVWSPRCSCFSAFFVIPCPHAEGHLATCDRRYAITGWTPQEVSLRTWSCSEWWRLMLCWCVVLQTVPTVWPGGCPLCSTPVWRTWRRFLWIRSPATSYRSGDR